MIKEIVFYHLHYIKQESVMEILYKTKKNISELFDVPLKTLNNDLTEMRRIEQFQRYILKPSHKRVYISIEGYEQFLQYKQKKYEEAM